VRPRGRGRGVTNSELSSREGWDRTDLALPGRQKNELVERVLKRGPRRGGRGSNDGAPVLLPWLAGPKAGGQVLWTWFPGFRRNGGTTRWADVVVPWAAAEPTGRLPWTLPADERDVPVPRPLPGDGLRPGVPGGLSTSGYRGLAARRRHPRPAPFRARARLDGLALRITRPHRPSRERRHGRAGGRAADPTLGRAAGYRGWSSATWRPGRRVGPVPEAAPDGGWPVRPWSPPGPGGTRDRDGDAAAARLRGVWTSASHGWVVPPQGLMLRVGRSVEEPAVCADSIPSTVDKRRSRPVGAPERRIVHSGAGAGHRCGSVWEERWPTAVPGPKRLQPVRRRRRP